jgi:hypothetical protein
MEIRERNLAIWRFVILPWLFLTVALLGGLRVADKGNFVFLKPSLITLVLALMLVIWFLRGGFIKLEEWVSADIPFLTNCANVLNLLIIFFASTQIINSVLPETGLFNWLIALFFFWTLWNNLFADFSAKKILQNLGAMLGLAFILKYLVFALMTAPNESWWHKLAETVFNGISFGVLQTPVYSPTSGYISFFALVLYGIGLFTLQYQTEKPKTDTQ